MHDISSACWNLLQCIFEKHSCTISQLVYSLRSAWRVKICFTPFLAHNSLVSKRKHLWRVTVILANSKLPRIWHFWPHTPLSTTLIAEKRKQTCFHFYHWPCKLVQKHFNLGNVKKMKTKSFVFLGNIFVEYFTSSDCQFCRSLLWDGRKELPAQRYHNKSIKSNRKSRITCMYSYSLLLGGMRTKMFKSTHLWNESKNNLKYFVWIT